MRTNIDIDDDLMAEMQKWSGAATKKAAVEEAMRFYVQLKKQGEIRKLFGKVHIDPEYDYKKMRENRFPDWTVDRKSVARLAKPTKKRKIAA